ncbi:MAG: radical SAM protein, partial [Acetobacteraceae bacterium]|nr:radical SAM protein [Acetobacteraceae bacterium]
VPGAGTEPPTAPHPDPLPASGGREGPAQREGEGQLTPILERATAGETLNETEIAQLFAARGEEIDAVCRAADELRQRVNGDTVSYVVTRNINYTNVCYFRCQFCAFSKGKLTENLRGRPYDLDLPEIQRRVEEAWDRGATEVCMQGGIHPEYTGATYLAICRAIKEAVPDIHIHAFSPLEIWQGAKTLGRTLADFLRELKAAGLSSLPGTAAEILDDEVRAVICPDKIKTD